jgi:hypothetical protein
MKPWTLSLIIIKVSKKDWYDTNKWWRNKMNLEGEVNGFARRSLDSDQMVNILICQDGRP